MCAGDRGKNREGYQYSYRGTTFYRIIDQFIDQMGNLNVDSAITDGEFDDDPGGLALEHDRPGLLSAANAGPNTNNGHFSIMVNPAPHLNGHYTIFGEVVEGMDVVYAVNKLSKTHPKPGSDYEADMSAGAVVKDCGQILPSGAIVSPPSYWVWFPLLLWYW